MDENLFNYLTRHRLSEYIPELNNVYRIRKNAFYNTQTIKSIDLSDSKLLTLDESAFSYCRNMTSIILPNSVKTINDYCFSDCSSLSSITIPNSVKTINNYCFMNCSSLSSITISNSVESIGTQCFSNCSNLTSVEIPVSVNNIGYYCFTGCNNLTTIIINKPQDSISGAPWSAPNATVVWNG